MKLKRKYFFTINTLKQSINFMIESSSVLCAPTDNLSACFIDRYASVGSDTTKVSQILKGLDFRFMQAIQNGLDMANKNAISLPTVDCPAP